MKRWHLYFRLGHNKGPWLLSEHGLTNGWVSLEEFLEYWKKENRQDGPDSLYAQMQLRWE